VSECTPITSAIRVFLAIENRFLRESLLRLFRKRPDFVVVGHASPMEKEAVEMGGSECDVLVGDSFVSVLLPEWSLTKDAANFRASVILIGMDCDEQQFLAAVRSGINGYLLQDASASEVVAGARAVARGESICPPQLCTVLFRAVAQSAKQPLQNPPAKPDLTLRQQQLVALMAKGLTNKEIAAQLNISEFTVRNHIHRILKQVDAESRDEAVETIRAHGYLTAV
jgi:two-component system, NarL family, nitrate/nitrite response regulator NarL